MTTQAQDPHKPVAGEHEILANVLENLVGATDHRDGTTILVSSVSHNALTPATTSTKENYHWWERFFPEGLSDRIQQLFADHHMGNFVAIRGQPGVKIFESMPIYVRVGMHLLFFKAKEESFLRYESVEDLLKTASVRQGRIYDDESDPKAVLAHVQSFVETYSIDLSELEQPDPARYPSFNSFFFRKLRPGARPISEPANDRVVSSCADCRITVFENVDQATKVWIKGKEFTIGRLLSDTNLADREFPPGSSLAIFRLAPADYHRYHHPVGPAVCGPTRHCDGEYYTVNPQAVNEDFDVFTCNRRDVLLLDWSPTPSEHHAVAFVSIGAMLVGSIGWTNSNQGSSVKRGDELGYFAYGGSTCITVFPPAAKVVWDPDLMQNSLAGLETMVRVGDRIGVSEV
ncbi:hypothetical protein IE53DRAFT_330720 [Violaceomyces palustris]|uniref:Uncharacterized protein n=1 Tax=Violaceomyces palustris TaxID=1673888 RepID=A0ACD0NWK1_9BASI|nr:hypothetical protein IE53DRAFT_330720 [Violaceomyces palustris]